MIISGRELAEQILTNLSFRVKKLQETYDVTPHMAIVRIGDDPATTSYLNQKEKMAKKIGAEISIYTYPADATQEKLTEALKFLQKDAEVHGLILQLPFPKESTQLQQEKLLMEIGPEKDVDGFHPQTKFVVPLAAAVIEILKEIHFRKDPLEEIPFHMWLESRNIVVMGKGKTGGQPTITLLQQLGLKPVVIDSKTKNPEALIKTADILIATVGKKHLITKIMLKPEVILVGVGIGKGEDGKFFGDYDPEAIKDTASFYTPIPGGVGPVNVAKLMENLVIATENSLKN